MNNEQLALIAEEFIMKAGVRVTRGAVVRNHLGCVGLVTSDAPTLTGEWLGVALQDHEREFGGKTWKTSLGGCWQATNRDCTLLYASLAEMLSISSGKK